MATSYQIVVCGGIVPDPLQTLEPVAAPTGPSLKNELMLPAVLDPWAAHALYEAAHLAKAASGSKVWLVSLGPKAKLQQVMMTIAQKVPFELVPLGGVNLALTGVEPGGRGSQPGQHGDQRGPFLDLPDLAGRVDPVGFSRVQGLAHPIHGRGDPGAAVRLEQVDGWEQDHLPGGAGLEIAVDDAEVRVGDREGRPGLRAAHPLRGDIVGAGHAFAVLVVLAVDHEHVAGHAGGGARGGG